MIKERDKRQNQIEIVMIEQLILQDHLLKKIDKYIDFSFVNDLTNDLICRKFILVSSANHSFIIY